MLRNSGAFPNISLSLWNNHWVYQHGTLKILCTFAGDFFMIRFSAAFTFLLFICLCSCSSEKKAPAVIVAPPVDSTPIIFKQINGTVKQEQLDTFFSHRFVEGKFSGCVLVAQRGIVLYEKAFGWRDHEKRDSLELSHSFQLASVSKQFTAAAIMLLHQQGKLNYDDTAGKYIPGFPWHGVTIRHLLTHRAGLDKYTNICDNYYRDRKLEPPSYFTNDSALRLMTDLHVHAFHKPDEKFKYSNTGYIILANIVERISGKPYHAFMKENFFDPLGMKNTWVATDGMDHPGKARGYFGQWKWWSDNFLDGVTGDKGVYASVGDMFLWDRAMKKGTILKPEILQDAFTGASPELNEKRPWNYGFGWRTIRFDDGAQAVFHNGWWHAYTTTFYRGISDDVTIIILCNKQNKGIYNTRPVLAILGAHHLPFDDEEGGSDSETTAETARGESGSPEHKKK